MKNWSISELLAAGWKPAAVTENEGDEGYTPKTILLETWLEFAFNRYGDRVFIYPNDTVEQSVTTIDRAWFMFKLTHAREFDKMWRALETEYKPLENYSMLEHGNDSRSVEHTAEISRTGTDTSKLQKSGTVSTVFAQTTSSDVNDVRTDDMSNELKRTGDTTTSNITTATSTDTTSNTTTNTGTQSTSGTEATTNSNSAYDEDTLSVRDKQDNTSSQMRTDNLSTTSTNSGDVKTTANNNITVTNNTTDSYTADNTVTNNVKTTGKNDTTNTLTNDTSDTETRNITDTTNTTDNTTDGTNHTLTRSGNIGVTTSQQMLSSEINLRVRNMLLYYVVELFISQFTTW